MQRSIEEDRAHRRRVRQVVLGLSAAIAAIAGYLISTVSIEDGRVDMPFRNLELLVTAIMIGFVAVMGPAIRRFGQTYERAVFAGSPNTGTQVLRLLDIAYYLTFGAYILLTLMFEPPRHLLFHERQFGDQLLFEAERLGGLLLLTGALHAVLLLALPVIGLVHSANLRRARIAAGATSRDAGAVKIDRAVGVGVWIVALWILFQMVIGVLGLLIALGAG